MSHGREAELPVTTDMNVPFTPGCKHFIATIAKIFMKWSALMEITHSYTHSECETLEYKDFFYVCNAMTLHLNIPPGKQWQLQTL